MSILATEFRIPRKEILTKDDLAKFHESEAYEEFLNFIVKLNNSVKGLPLSTECHVSQVSDYLVLKVWVLKYLRVFNYVHGGWITWKMVLLMIISESIYDQIPRFY